MSVFIMCAPDPMTVLWSALVLLALAAVFGVLLAVLGKKFAVKKDEKEEEIRRHLSGANCGACGYAGCDAFAKALAEGKADVSSCSATAASEKKIIGEIMGVAVDAEDTKIVVACNGGNNARDKYEYMGYGDCRSMELLGGGRKVCPWGCWAWGRARTPVPSTPSTSGTAAMPRWTGPSASPAANAWRRVRRNSSSACPRARRCTSPVPTACAAARKCTQCARRGASAAGCAPRCVRSTP